VVRQLAEDRAPKGLAGRIGDQHGREVLVVSDEDVAPGGG
jgi:hypothetical protein